VKLYYHILIVEKCSCWILLSIGFDHNNNNNNDNKVIRVIPEMHGGHTTLAVHKKANSTNDVTGGMII
jgi:hypothetical protein